jgi:hypothetical protein
VIKKSATTQHGDCSPAVHRQRYVEGVPAKRVDKPDETTLSPLFYLFTATQRAHALLDRAMAESPLRSEEYAAYSSLLPIARGHVDPYVGGGQDHRPWIAPDIPVELSSINYFAGVDPVLDAALNA